MLVCIQAGIIAYKREIFIRIIHLKCSTLENKEIYGPNKRLLLNRNHYFKPYHCV